MSIVQFLYKFDKYVLNPVILLMFAVALMYFVYGVVRFLSIDAAEKGSSREEARNSIMWGIIGMVVMFSVYGLIKLILVTFGITGTDVGPAKEFIKFT